VISLNNNLSVSIAIFYKKTLRKRINQIKIQILYSQKFVNVYNTTHITHTIAHIKIIKYIKMNNKIQPSDTQDNSHNKNYTTEYLGKKSFDKYNNPIIIADS